MSLGIRECNPSIDADCDSCGLFYAAVEQHAASVFGRDPESSKPASESGE